MSVAAVTGPGRVRGRGVGRGVSVEMVICTPHRANLTRMPAMTGRGDFRLRPILGKPLATPMRFDMAAKALNIQILGSQPRNGSFPDPCFAANEPA